MARYVLLFKLIDELMKRWTAELPSHLLFRALAHPFADPHSGGSTVSASHGKLAMQVADRHGYRASCRIRVQTWAFRSTRLSSTEPTRRSGPTPTPRTAGEMRAAVASMEKPLSWRDDTETADTVVIEAVAQQNTTRPSRRPASR